MSDHPKYPILPLLTADLIGATASYSDEEFGCYVRLLMSQWDKLSIPNDFNKLNRIAPTTEKHWELIKDKFPEIAPGLLQNKKMEIVRAEIAPALDKLYGKAQKRIRKEAAPKEAAVLVYPYSSPSFMEAWNHIIGEPKWKGKTKKALQLNLLLLSKYPEPEAIYMIEKAISAGWQGIFPLHENERKQFYSSSNSGGAPPRINDKKSAVNELGDQTRQYLENRKLQYPNSSTEG